MFCVLVNLGVLSWTPAFAGVTPQGLRWGDPSGLRRGDISTESAVTGHQSQQ